MKCPNCQEVLRGPTCDCGWKPEGKKPSTRYHPCTWETGGRQCRAIATIRTSEWRCSWHQTWAQYAPWTGLTEHDEFSRWLEQFHAGGEYEHNPGQWRASIETLWPIIQGLEIERRPA
jgi:hypothetical protein